jgi:hypothetical protein
MESLGKRPIDLCLDIATLRALAVEHFEICVDRGTKFFMRHGRPSAGAETSSDIGAWVGEVGIDHGAQKSVCDFTR